MLPTYVGLGSSTLPGAPLAVVAGGSWVSFLCELCGPSVSSAVKLFRCPLCNNPRQCSASAPSDATAFIGHWETSFLMLVFSAQSRIDREIRIDAPENANHSHLRRNPGR
jgi:hypothetical protein